VQLVGDAVEDLLIPEPAGGLAVDFQGRRLEDQDMTASLIAPPGTSAAGTGRTAI
jgi:hypothetical protein